MKKIKSIASWLGHKCKKTTWSNSIKHLSAQFRGSAAEQKALKYLKAKQLRFVATNYRCFRGEIDIIMKDGDCWVFVEVKYRQNHAHGYAVEFFTASKRKKVQLAIDYYFKQQGINPNNTAHRIDVIAIDDEQLTWLKAV